MKEQSEKVGLKLNIKKTKIMASGPILYANRGKMEKVTDYFLGLQNHYGWWLQPCNLKMLALWEKKSYDKPRQHIKKKRHHFADNGAMLCSVTQLCPTLQPCGLQPTRCLCPWGFCRQEYWSGLPCPPPGDLPNKEIEPRSPTLLAHSLTSEPPGKPCWQRSI